MSFHMLLNSGTDVVESIFQWPECIGDGFERSLAAAGRIVARIADIAVPIHESGSGQTVLIRCEEEDLDELTELVRRLKHAR